SRTFRLEAYFLSELIFTTYDLTHVFCHILRTFTISTIMRRHRGQHAAHCRHGHGRQQTFKHSIKTIVIGHIIGNIFDGIATGLTLYLFLRFNEVTDLVSVIFVRSKRYLQYHVVVLTPSYWQGFMQILFYTTDRIILKFPSLPPPPWHKQKEVVIRKLPRNWKF